MSVTIHLHMVTLDNVQTMCLNGCGYKLAVMSQAVTSVF